MRLTDKVKIELTERDKEYIKLTDTSDMCRYLDSLRDKNFKVGDVLIKKKKEISFDSNHDAVVNWEPVRVPYRKVPAKFVVVHVDGYGIPVVKRLSVNGKLTKTIQSLADVDFRTEIFEEDPDYAEATLLGEEEFDPIKNERDGWRKS